MDEKKNNENQSYLSGFDSVEQVPPKKEETGTFNPTPMFSGMKPQNGYSITPKGESFDTPDTTPDVINATPDTTPEKEVFVDIPKTDEPKTTEASKTENINQQSIAPSVEQPPKNEPPVFIPNGTYSYSANTNNPETSPKPVSPTPTYTPPVFSADSNGSQPQPSPTPAKPKKDKKPKKYGAGVIIVSVLLAALIGAGSGVFGVLFANKYFDTTDTASSSSKEETTTQQTVPNITVDETVNSSIEAVAKKAGPSIIGIRTTAAVTNFFGGSSEATGEGSGIIYTQDGYIITNYHVIESAVESSNSKVEVFLSSDTETALNATVIGYNIASDLAVVKVEKTGLPAIQFADSNKLSVGQYAIAIGNPGGLEFIGSVSSGVISGLNRSVTIGTGNTMSLIQTDAAINPGNSGGALVDIQGNLIGVNSVKLVSTGYEGMGFAIPSNTVKQICDNIIDKQNDPTPYLGIQISQSYSSEQLVALGYPAGAVVVSVDEGGPAYESKIQRGDIITEFNGVAVNDYKELENAISQCKPGDSVTIKIFRAGRFYSSHINVAANSAQ